jgi:hypothetical protein
MLILLAAAGVFLPDLKAEPSYDYPTKARRIGLKGQIFSPLTWEQARKGVPEIKLLSKKEEEIEYIGDKKELIDLKLWQESPSRIIFHNGKYHTWIMHLKYFKDSGKELEPKNYYLTSDDGTRWKVEAELLPGEPGSFDDFWREGVQVVAFDGKFWMFYAANASDDVTYGMTSGMAAARMESAYWLPINRKDPGSEPPTNPCLSDRKIRAPGTTIWPTIRIRFISRENGSSITSPGTRKRGPKRHYRVLPWRTPSPAPM